MAETCLLDYPLCWNDLVVVSMLLNKDLCKESAHVLLVFFGSRKD